MTVDLEAQVVHLPGDEDIPFEVDPFARQMLLAGTDEIGWMLARSEAIDAWEAGHPARDRHAADLRHRSRSHGLTGGLRALVHSEPNALHPTVRLPRRHPTMSTLPYDRPSDPAKRHSAALTDGPDRAGARAMLKAVGFTDEDLAKPIVGVATSWIETMPCNLNQRRLATFVKEGIRAAGGTPMEFNTVAVSDGVSMGTEGMKASLVSREVVADSIELVARGHLFDGLVCLVGCDKTNPGAAMAVGRLDIPSVLLYNGTIYPGTYMGQPQDIVSVYEAIGAYRAGKISGRGALRHRAGRVPRPRRVRRPVHGQHDEHGPRVHGPLAGRPERHPGRGRGQGRGGAALR